MGSVVGPCCAFGQRFSVGCDDAVLAGWIGQLFAPMAAAGGGAFGSGAGGSHDVRYEVVLPRDGAPGEVRRDGEVVGSPSRVGGVLPRLLWAVNRQVIDRSWDERLILHAGAVEVDGRVVVLPAAMESGKTTLTAGLLSRGAAYLSDEAVALGHGLAVEGYPKPLSVDPGSWQVLAHLRPRVPAGLEDHLGEQWQVPVQHVAPVVREGRLGLVVFPRYEAGAATSFTPLARSAAVAALAGCTFGEPGGSARLAQLEALAGVAAGVPAYRLVSGSLEEACAAVLGAVPAG